MCVNWKDTFSKLPNIHNNESKRILRRQIPKSELVIRNEVRNNVLQLINIFTVVVALNEIYFDENQYIGVKKLFTSVRVKVIRTDQVLKLHNKVRRRVCSAGPRRKWPCRIIYGICQLRL